MIIVHGIIPVRPDSREQALDMARRMSEATQAEPGCISYDFYVGLADPNSLMLFQEWETMEALMAHFQTPHMAEFNAVIPQLIAGPPSINRCEVSGVTKLM